MDEFSPDENTSGARFKFNEGFVKKMKKGGAIPKKLFKDKENNQDLANFVIEKILEIDDRKLRFSQRPNNLA